MPEADRGCAEDCVIVKFGDIHEVDVISVQQVDDERLRQTPDWRFHERQIEEKHAFEARIAENQTAKQESKERAELARLQSKYADDDDRQFLVHFVDPKLD